MNEVYNYNLTIETPQEYDLATDSSQEYDLNFKDNVIIVERETYTYHQNVASAEWEIHHNLNRNPSVTVVDSAGTQVLGEVQYINNNFLIVRFVGAFSGTAYLN